MLAEWIFAVVCIFFGTLNGDSGLIVAAAIFVVAGNLGYLTDVLRKKVRNELGR